MQAGQMLPGDVIVHTEVVRLRSCDRSVRRTRRWIFVRRDRVFDDFRGTGYFDHLTVTDMRGRGEFGLIERDCHDWEVEGDPCRKWSCRDEAPHSYAGCLDYHTAKA